MAREFSTLELAKKRNQAGKDQAIVAAKRKPEPLEEKTLVRLEVTRYITGQFKGTFNLYSIVADKETKSIRRIKIIEGTDFASLLDASERFIAKTIYK